MVGATIMGAMAADLADYPAPFVDGCIFDGAILVGESAAAEDVVGAVDIASALAVSGTGTEGTGGTTVSASGESVKIETSTKSLTLGPSYQNITQVKATDLDDDDLPTILADGTYTADDGAEYDYTQKLKFNPEIGLDFNEDSDYNDKENAIRVYVAKKENFMNFTLDFTKDVEADYTTTGGTSTLDDVDDTVIEMLGKTYDITKAENTTAVNFEFTLMGGAIRDILEQGQSKTYTLNDKDYEVEVTYIGATPNVKFKVNGEVSDLMVTDDTWKTADGTTIGVRELMEEEAGEVDADKVEFYLGAEKLTLQDTTAGTADANDKIQLDDEDVDELYVDIITTTVTSKVGIDKIILSWTPDDEVFITEESEAVFPLNSYKVNYEGFTTPVMEEILIQNNGDQELELVIPITSGKATIPLLATNATTAGAVFDAIGGEDSDEILLTGSGAALNFNETTDEFFVVSDTGSEESFLIEVTDIDDENGVDFKDAVSGDTFLDKKNGTTFSVGDISLTVTGLQENGPNVTITRVAATTVFDRVFSAEGFTVMLPVANYSNDGYTTVESPLIYTNVTNGTMAQTSYVLQMFEEDRDEGIDTTYAGTVGGNVGGGTSINVTLGITGTTTLKTQVNDFSTAQKGILVNNNYFEVGDTDEFEGYVESDLGTQILYDTDPDQNTVKIIYHGGESYGNVFVSSLETSFGSVGAGTASVCKVSVPPAMLDSEVADVSAQNLILVGGPCANAAAAEVMGVASTIPECLEGFEEGKAMIKLYGEDKVAMLVAGATALDTRRASRVLANFGDYALSGAEVEVSGTTLSDIDVMAVTE